MDNNIYIKIIEAWLSFNEWFKKEDIENKINANESEAKTIKKLSLLAYQNYFHWMYYRTPFIVHKEGSREVDCNYIISYEASFDYYDYKELEQSTENAKTARFWSITALIFSIISLLVASSLTYYYWEKQLSNPITVSWSQIEELKLSNDSVVEQVKIINDNLDNTNQYLDDIDSKLLKINK